MHSSKGVKGSWDPNPSPPHLSHAIHLCVETGPPNPAAPPVHIFHKRSLTQSELQKILLKWLPVFAEKKVYPYGDCVNFLGHKPGISVVISTYNRPFLAISLIRQIMTQVDLQLPLEVLMVSDGGNPGSLDVIKQMTAKSQWPVRFFDSMQADAYALTLCRNIGIRFARYDRLVFLDDDLSIGPDFLSHYASAPEGLCLGRIDSIEEREKQFEVVPDLRGRQLTGPTRRIDPWETQAGIFMGRELFCTHPICHGRRRV